MSESVVAYPNSLPGFDSTLPADQKRRLEADVRKWLLSSFQADLDDKVARSFETRTFGPLPLVHEFVKFMPDLFGLYINGFFYAAVALAGLTAERFCCDLIEVANVQVDGKTLSSDEKRAMTELRFYDLIELLAEWGLIQENTKQSLHEIRKIRNRYVHPRQMQPGKQKADAERMISALCDVARNEFGPSATGRYTIENGALKIRTERHNP